MKDKLNNRIKIGRPTNIIGQNWIPHHTVPIKHKTATNRKYFSHLTGFRANQITSGKFNGNSIKDAGFQAITS